MKSKKPKWAVGTIGVGGIIIASQLVREINAPIVAVVEQEPKPYKPYDAFRKGGK